MSDVSKIKLPDESVLNIKDYRIPGVDTEPTSGSDNVVTSGGVYQAIEDNAIITSAALNDLNDRLTNIQNTTSSLNESVSNLEESFGDGNYVTHEQYDEAEEVIATALVDLNDRIETVEDDYVTTEEYSQIESVARDTYTKQEVDVMLANIEVTETDPVFTASAASNITSSDINTWNSKQVSLVSGTNIKTINNTSLLGSGNINTPDTKNTAGTTNSTSKLYLVGATSQAANPQTYSNENVYEQNGELTASKFNGPLETSYTDTTNNLSMYKSVGLNKKVYTGVLGVANGSSPNNNTYANQSVYFLTIHPTSWDAEWSIKYKLNIHLDNESQMYKSSSTASNVSAGVYTRGIYDCNLTGTAGIYSTFHMFQSQKNTSYRPIYYHMFHSTTSAGYTAGNGHKIGVCFYSSYLPTPVTDYSSGSAVANTKYTRTIEVIVEEAVNCTFELADTLEVEGDAYRSDYTKLNTTYYTTNASSSNSAGRWINLSATTQGLYESGDDNTYTYTQQSSNYIKNTTKSGDTGVKLWSYPLVGFDKDGNAMGISVYSGSQSSNTTGISAKGTRLYCTEGFDYTKGVRYVSTSSSFAYNADMNVSTQINYSGLDLRYCDNCVPSSTANNLGLVNRKPVYLRGTIGNDGLFYLAPIDVTYNNGTYQRAWVQDIPSIENENGEYVYWFIGYPYYNSSYPAALYQLNLITQGELVWYKDGNVRPYVTPVTITETDPVFSASAAAGITSADITNWNGKTSNTGTITGITMNGASKGTSGVVDLGTVITSHAKHKLTTTNGTATAGGSTITYVESLTGTTTATDGDLALTATRKSVTIPAAVTESTVSGWGFTKNAAPGTLKTDNTTAQTASASESLTGTINLHKIAKTGNFSDLLGTESVMTVDSSHVLMAVNGDGITGIMGDNDSLLYALGDGNADGTEDYILATTDQIPTESTVAGWGFTKNTGTLTTETDPVFSASAAAGITSSDIINWNGKTSNTGTVTGVKMNGTTKNPTSGVVDLGTVITSETSLSKGTTSGSGNAVTDISVSGHQITLTKGSTFLTSETSLSKGTTSGSGNAVTDISVSGHQITLTKGSTFLTSETQLSKGSDSGSGNVVTDISVSNHQITLTKGSTVPVATSANAGKIPRITSGGAWEYVTPSAIYSGSGTPSNSTGNNGDIYLQTS